MYVHINMLLMYTDESINFDTAYLLKYIVQEEKRSLSGARRMFHGSVEAFRLRTH